MHFTTIAHELTRWIMRKSIDSNLCAHRKPYRAVTTLVPGERCVVVPWLVAGAVLLGTRAGFRVWSAS